MELYHCVIDTNCINILLDFNIGNKILRSCKIKITPYIYEHELDNKPRKKLSENFNLEIIQLDDGDREFAAKLIVQMTQKKELGQYYLRSRRLRSVPHIGECEAGALARKEKCDLVLLEKKATSIINQTFRHNQSIDVIYFDDFGLEILNRFGTEEEINDFLQEIKKRHYY